MDVIKRVAEIQLRYFIKFIEEEYNICVFRKHNNETGGISFIRLDIEDLKNIYLKRIVEDGSS